INESCLEEFDTFDEDDALEQLLDEVLVMKAVNGFDGAYP
ncbi:1198_t:CDS:2, partial [Racocetra fulgida]